jgi:hypothetical protein
MVHNHGYYGTKSGLVWYLFSGRKLLMVLRAATAAKDAKDWSLPSFGSHLNPISTRGGRLCPPYTGVLGWLKFAVAALVLNQCPNIYNGS